MILDKIKKPNDIHKIPLSDFPALASEIRNFLVDTISKTGGHLSSNLGAVELTLALHNVLDLKEDKIIWDVGHQAYTHKILTGRREQFDTLRKEGGLAGFPKRAESFCDAFDTGHSSNSISAGLGYVRARDLLGKDYRVVSVIGDGALTGGMAYEALNNAALLETNFIIVLNDNNMSISRNIGGMSMYLGALRTSQAYTGMKLSVTRTLNKIPGFGDKAVETMRKTKSSIKQLVIPGMLFENMGITYLGPVDGHDMVQMMRTFNEAKKVKGAVLVHVLTQKGLGYGPAEEHPDRFHGTGPFDVATGEPLSPGEISYTDVFGSAVADLGAEVPNLAAVTAAMPQGTGLKKFAHLFPDRFFDVGIAEEHAVTFAAGLSLGGMIPVVAVYSSFLQRGIDQIIHDVCMQNLHVIFAIDRAGIVGADGETHQGCFDISYLSMCPHMTVMAPKNAWELKEMLRAAVLAEGPVAIRYPKGGAYTGSEGHYQKIERGKSEVLIRGEKIAILALGSMVCTAETACRDLAEEGIHPTLVNARFVRPLDKDLLDELGSSHGMIITMEENVRSGGMGEHVTAYLKERYPDVRTKILSVPDKFIPHGSVESLRRRCGLSADKLEEVVRNAWLQDGDGSPLCTGTEDAP